MTDRLAEIEEGIQNWRDSNDEYYLEELVREGHLAWLIAEVRRLREMQNWRSSSLIETGMSNATHGM